MGHALHEIDARLRDADGCRIGGGEGQRDRIRKARVYRAPAVDAPPVDGQSRHAIRSVADGDVFQQGEGYRKLVFWGFGNDDVLAEVRTRYLVDGGGKISARRGREAGV